MTSPGEIATEIYCSLEFGPRCQASWFGEREHTKHLAASLEQYTHTIMWATKILILVSTSAGMMVTPSRPCPQRLPVEVLADSGKTIVSQRTCGQAVHVEDLQKPPIINVIGIDRNGTYSLFLLRDNDRKDGTYSIVWHLAQIKPFGDTLTKNQSSPPVLIKYSPPFNLTANYTILVYREHILPVEAIKLHVPLSVQHQFRPQAYQNNFFEGQMVLTSQTDFIIAATGKNQTVNSHNQPGYPAVPIGTFNPNPPPPYNPHAPPLQPHNPQPLPPHQPYVPQPLPPLQPYVPQTLPPHQPYIPQTLPPHQPYVPQPQPPQQPYIPQPQPPQKPYVPQPQPPYNPHPQPPYNPHPQPPHQPYHPQTPPPHTFNPHPNSHYHAYNTTNTASKPQNNKNAAPHTFLHSQLLALPILCLFTALFY